MGNKYILKEDKCFLLFNSADAAETFYLTIAIDDVFKPNYSVYINYGIYIEDESSIDECFFEDKPSNNSIYLDEIDDFRIEDGRIQCSKFMEYVVTVERYLNDIESEYCIKFSKVFFDIVLVDFMSVALEELDNYLANIKNQDSTEETNMEKN